MLTATARLRGLGWCVIALAMMPLADSVAYESVPVKTWEFAGSTSSWRAENDCQLSTTKEGMKIESTGQDPYLVSTAELPAGWNRISIDATFS